MSKPFNPSRRTAIRSLASASMLLPGMLHEMLAEGTPAAVGDPLAPKAPMFPAKAKRVIFLYMSGGVSHVDTFDPKPKLTADHHKKYKNDFLHASPWTSKAYSQNGVQVTELFPQVGACMDDICLVRSMYNDIPNHPQAILQVHGGSTVQPRPSIGSWVSYGLGTMSKNLPSYVVLAPEIPYAGSAAWDSGFLPAFHQGVRVIPGQEAIPNIGRSGYADIQDMDLGLIDFFNKRHADTHDADPALAARIKTFETAYGMQKEAPEVFDSKESDATLDLYGLQRDTKKGFGWMCLTARRLAERGVRFIEIIDGGYDKYTNWDAHLDIRMHEPLAKKADKPIAGLLKDLKSRGMLEDTLVVWTTEFGRKPADASPDEEGRTHWSTAYSSWMAGGGVKAGMVYGATDEYGLTIASNPVHIHDFQATILNQLGLDHTKLTFRHAGRDYRLTDVSGHVVKDIIG